MEKKDFKTELSRRIYIYSLRVIKLIKKMPRSIETDILGKQLIRSATSIAANLLEAKAASSKKDYINYYHYSLKSCNESKLWLALLRDTSNFEKNEIIMLYRETEEISKILGASIITMKRKNI